MANHTTNVLKKFIRIINQKLYTKTDFVIISNNCWGAEIYKSLGLAYNTPFVGLFIFGPDYLKLLKNLEYYLALDLYFVKESKWINTPVDYPIGLLEDVEIHFLHYNNQSEAQSKWARRLERMNKSTDKSNFFLKICDRDFADQNILNEFHDLPFENKISFGIFNLPHKNHIQIKESENNKTVPDGIKLYRQSYKYIDVLKWLNSGKLSGNLYSIIKSITNLL